MKAGKWNKALGYLKAAETWPSNLGWGEPYFADNRLTQFIIAYCSDKMGDKVQYNKSFSYISTYVNPDGKTSPLENRLSTLIKSGEKDFKSVTDALIREQGKNREIEILKRFQALL